MSALDEDDEDDEEATAPMRRRGVGRKGGHRHACGDECRKSCRASNQRTSRLRNLFNLTDEDYEKMLEYQAGVCAICGRPPVKIRLNVDHAHKSGAIRGLLCFLDNKALSMFGDNPDRLRAAIAYLADPPATRALGGTRYGRVGRVTNRVNKVKRQRKSLTSRP